MSTINSCTLFHFTSTIKSIKGILQNGVRLSYCYEECVNNFGFAIPMICFCDIPLLRTLKHRERYGDYMIGFDKDYLISNNLSFLNPVQYHSSFLLRNLGKNFFKTQLDLINHSFMNEMNRYINDNGYLPLVEKFGIDNALNSNEDLKYKRDQIAAAVVKLRYSLAFSKLYSSTYKGKKIINYDEREWRYVSNMATDSDCATWIPEITLTEFDIQKSSLNSRLWSLPEAYIEIKAKDIYEAINFIVVKKNSQIPAMIKFIRTSERLFGSIGITQEQKDILISRITSFEMIEKNF